MPWILESFRLVYRHLLKYGVVEEMIIARSHFQMLIHRYRGHHFRYWDHCVSFMQNTVNTVDILPNLTAELNIVVADGVLEADQRYRDQFRTKCKVHTLSR